MSEKTPFDLLKDEFGKANVQAAVNFIRCACDSRGTPVLVPATPERVRDVLEAVHGRLDVGAIRLKL